MAGQCLAGPLLFRGVWEMPFNQVSDCIKAAYRGMEVIGSGDVPSTSEYADALEALNNMLASWSVKRYVPPQLISESFSVSSGVSSRTIGPSGQLVTARPLKIVSAFLRDSANNDYPFGKIGNKTEYDAISYKSHTERPSEIFYLDTFPNGTIYFNSITDAAYTLYLQSQKQIVEFVAVTDTWSLPEEYDVAVKLNLQIHLSAEFGVQLSPAVVALAKESLRDLKRLRAAAQVEPVSLPSGVGFPSTSEYLGKTY